MWLGALGALLAPVPLLTGGLRSASPAGQAAPTPGRGLEPGS